jgi:large subunit ribosomal protein L13e
MFMEPIVHSSGKTRRAKGYSAEEVKQANLNVRSARKLGLFVDTRRNTVYEENVESIKKTIERENKKKEHQKKGKKLKAKKEKKKTESE